MVALTIPVAILAGAVTVIVTLGMLYVTYLGWKQDRHSPGGGDLPTPNEYDE